MIKPRKDRMEFPHYDWKKGYKDGKALEKDLKGFKYRGPGWYEGKTDTVHVRKIELSDEDLVGGNYKISLWVTVWNFPNARKLIAEEWGKIMGDPVYPTK